MPEIELLVLSNHAEALNGLLYLSGAGWTDLNRVAGEAGPPVTHFGVGVSVLVPWTETNRRHSLVIRLEHEDGEEVAPPLDATLEIGRPPGLPAGSDQRAVLAINADLVFPRPGGHRLVAELTGKKRTYSFRVHDLPSPVAPPGG